MKIVDEKGKTYNLYSYGLESEFEEMNLLYAKGPTRLPDCFNKYKLTLWEAIEVHLENGVLLSASVCNTSNTELGIVSLLKLFGLAGFS